MRPRLDWGGELGTETCFAAMPGRRSAKTGAAGTPKGKANTAFDALPVEQHVAESAAGGNAGDAATTATPRRRASTRRSKAAGRTNGTVSAKAQASKSGEQAQDGAPGASSAFWKKVRERTIFTLLMIGAFISILMLGPSYMVLLVLVLETLVYREITALFNIPYRPSLSGRQGSLDTDPLAPQQQAEETQREELWSKTLSWYFFAVCNFFLYGESLIYYFKHIVFIDVVFLPFTRHLRFISFMLYMIGFMAFVTNLKRQNLKRQFGLFCWVHMSLLLIVMSTHFLVNNILEGMIWFFLPASLVICNDVFAYVCGMLFGRTPLISLSPKKTVEGFVGAFVVTEVFAWFWAALFQRYKYMICPATNLSMTALSNVDCEVNPVFLVQHAALPGMAVQALSFLAQRPVTQITYTHFQLHALVMAAFASLVAPFGGFFASGFKRAFNIKDFGDSIPGHGGMTDRFDCQFIMGIFSYVYYSSIIREPRVTVSMAMELVAQLPIDRQHELLRELTQYLAHETQS